MKDNLLPSPLHRELPHESALLHVSGKAVYIDDLPAPPGMLYGHAVVSPVAHGRIRTLDVSAAREVAGVHAVLTAADIPGVNDASAFFGDEPLLAAGEVFCVGQHVALVVAESLEACRAGAAKVRLEIDELPAILTLPDAIAQQSFHVGTHVMQRGDVDAALAVAPLRFDGVVESPDQEHFYLETHVALALPGEAGAMKVLSSTQHPSEVQNKVAGILGVPRALVTVEVLRMGGAFGGKETQGNMFGGLAALGAWATGRPVKVWLNRDQDMTQTGKRHPFYQRYEAGFDNEGHLLALRVESYANAGWAQDLSRGILDRCLYHIDNSYYIPALHFLGKMCKLHNVSHTAFRGFGGPQGMVLVETVMNRAAERLGIDPAELRRRNFYGSAPRNVTPYGMEVVDCRIERIYARLMETGRYAERRAAIDAANASSRWVKRGLAFQPVKFGISFTNTPLNQGGALVLVYRDGSVQVNHGGTEMGQGLHTKVLAVAAHELGVPLNKIRCMNTATDKVPNTSPTAASTGSDINGAAVAKACREIIARLRPVACKVLGVAADEVENVRFADGTVSLAGGPSVPFGKVVSQAYFDQVSLACSAYYATPNIFYRYDGDVGSGKPFHYFAYGGALLEVEVNGLTGEHRLVRVDVLQDVGDSLVPSIDKGQIEGALIQGWGWLTCEELKWSPRGVLLTHSPDTYKIPSFGSAPLPECFNVELLPDAAQHDVVHGSKAVGEPPFMLAIGVVTALRHAIGAFGGGQQGGAVRDFELRLPATAEAVLRAIGERCGEASD